MHDCARKSHHSDPDDQSSRQLIVFWSNRRATVLNYCENAARSKWFMKICIKAVR
jgi:hypothetical protein